jgi:hypothetical protein
MEAHEWHLMNTMGCERQPARGDELSPGRARCNKPRVMMPPPAVCAAAKARRTDPDTVSELFTMRTAASSSYCTMRNE